MNKNTQCNCEKYQHQVCAHRVPLFSSLNGEELKIVVGLIKRKAFLKGELIITEGSQTQSLIIINGGQAKAFKYTLEGKEQILYIFSEGDFFGEKDLLRNREATYHVQALEDTGVCMIEQKDFQELLRQHPDIALKLFGELCNRLEKLEDALSGMGTKSIETRVGTVLLEFAQKYGKDHPKGILIELPLSREGIANYIGVARETVSRKMSLLHDDGIIEMIGNKKIIILDKRALEEQV